MYIIQRRSWYIATLCFYVPLFSAPLHVVQNLRSLAHVDEAEHRLQVGKVKTTLLLLRRTQIVERRAGYHMIYVNISP